MFVEKKDKLNLAAATGRPCHSRGKEVRRG